MTDFTAKERHEIRFTVKKELNGSSFLYRQDITFISHLIIGSHSDIDIIHVAVQISFTRREEQGSQTYY